MAARRDDGNRRRAARTVACGRSGTDGARSRCGICRTGAVRSAWCGGSAGGECPDPDCERRTFTERSELVEGSLTRRARAEICRAVGEGGHTVAEQARRFGIGWSTAMAAVRDHGRPLVEDARRLHRVRTLGVDEHKMLAAGPRHHTVFATQLVDLEPWPAARRRPRPEREVGVRLAGSAHPLLA